jgi:nucleotide-binding universal stress UspA family protein
MRILAALDQNPYSARALEQVANLAENTWSDVTILGVQAKPSLAVDKPIDMSGSKNLDPSLRNALQTYRHAFLDHFSGPDSPYTSYEYGYDLLEVRRGIWQEFYVGRSTRKNLSVRMRTGNPARAVLAESREGGSDLIVLGCDERSGCLWDDGTAVPQKVATEAGCSVWVVKNVKKIKKVLCCLDHDRISQESLEMVSQMVTIHQAELNIVGLTEGEGLREKVERKMDWILNYYVARKIKPLIELVELSSLESFIAREGRRSLTALWMGQKSLVQKVFSRSKVGTLIRAGETSVLILR